ncbi:FkbM family methyltransferase [Spirosoma pollinicola]|uniref:Methyltransferase FkbM domain-containing protein n=1 Tax=Spirosoma pollinicola TaxID=2057025 RepID=A0A2K8YUY2_9BACT|nr:FkbM family methyltransferase [Spirosoma pollinicola]AUD01423.1 hypothetical protein CWM47_06125 [Spirosoma pollinicola]
MNIYSNKIISKIIWKLFINKPKFRLWLTKLLIRDKNAYIEIAGSKIYANTITEIGYVRAAKNANSNIVFRDEIASIINIALIISPQDTFIDIGANVGLYSSIISRLQYVYPNIKFYAFEANPETGEKLKRTLLDKNANIEILGLSDSEKVIPFAKGAVSGVFGALINASHNQNSNWIVNISTRRLDSFALDGHSMILKIDVEGHEWEVLQGASKFFDETRIKAIYLDGYDDERVPSFLSDYGFVAFDGRSMSNAPTQYHSVLYINEKWLAK